METLDGLLKKNEGTSKEDLHKRLAELYEEIADISIKMAKLEPNYEISISSKVSGEKKVYIVRDYFYVYGMFTFSRAEHAVIKFDSYKLPTRVLLGDVHEFINTENGEVMLCTVNIAKDGAVLSKMDISL